MNYARSLILIISTVIVTLLITFAVETINLDLTSILLHVIVLCISGVVIYLLLHALLKQKIDNILISINSSINDLILIIRNEDNKNDSSLDKSYNSLKTFVKSILFLFVVSSGSFVIFALLTNSILISNLIVNLNYTNKLVDQNNLFKESIRLTKDNNISTFTDKIEFINKQIEKKSEYLNKISFISFSNFGTFNFPSNGLLVVQKNNDLYSIDTYQYRGNEQFKNKVNTCQNKDQYCTGSVFDSIQNIEDIIETDKSSRDLNPYIVSLINYMKQSRLINNLRGQSINFVDSDNQINIFKFLNEVQLQCGHKEDFATYNFNHYITALNSASSIKYTYKNIEHPINNDFNLKAINISDMTVTDKTTAINLLSALSYFSGYGEHFKFTNKNRIEFYIEEIPYSTASNIAYYNLSIEKSIGNLLSNFLNTEKLFYETIHKLFSSCQQELKKLHGLKFHMNDQLLDLIDKKQ